MDHNQFEAEGQRGRRGQRDGTGSENIVAEVQSHMMSTLQF